MLTLLPLLPFLAGATTTVPAIPQDDWVVLGEVQAFGQTDPDGRKESARKVLLKFPKDFVEPVDYSAPGFGYQGGKVLLNEFGNLGRAHWGPGGWTEFKTLRDRAAANIAAGNATPWKVKAILFTRTDLLRKDKHGVLHIEDTSLFEDDITLLLESFARMEAIVEAFSGGAVDVQIDYSLERDPIAEEYTDAVFNWGPERGALDFYGARFTRGDYDSVMAVYAAAEAEVPSMGTTRGRANGAVLSHVLYSNGREQGAHIVHTQELVRQFLEGARVSTFAWGYGAEYDPLLPATNAGMSNGYERDGMGYSGSFGWLRDYARCYVSGGIWSRVRNRVEPDYAAAYGQTKAFSGTLSRWDDVAVDPWAGLPTVTAKDIATKIGATSIAIQENGASVLWIPSGGEFRTPIKTSMDLEDAMLNNQLNAESEAISRFGYADRDLLIIRYDMADFVIRHLGDHPAGATTPANVMGITNVRGRPYVVVDTKLANDTLAEANLIGSGNQKTGVAVITKGVFETGDPVSVRFAADTPDARFTVTDLEGNGLTLSNGALQIPTQSPGVHVLNAVAALPSGERIERPFVIRVVSPVTIDQFRYARGNLNFTVTNNGAERPVNVDVQLPSGWTYEQNLSNFKLGAYQTAQVFLNPKIPAGAVGTAGATLSVGVNGRAPAVARTGLSVPSGDNLVVNSFETGAESWDARRNDGGTYSAASEEAAGHGRALAVRDGGGARFGKVTAFGKFLANGAADPDFAGYSVEDFPFVNFKLNSTGTAPLALTFVVDGRRFVAMISGDADVRDDRTAIARAKFVPNGTWQQVSYNLAAALPSSGSRRFVSEVSLGDPRTFAVNQYSNDKVQTHWVDDFTISRSAVAASEVADDDAELNPVGDMASTDPYLRAVGAAKATGTPAEMTLIRTLVKDPSNMVRLNAVAALARVKDPESLPALLEASRFERVPYPAVMMVRALAFQDTAEAWAGIRTIIRQGRAEEMSVAEAARQMAAKQDPAFIEDLSILITAKSWKARAAGASAMSSIPTNPGAQMAMTYLIEVDPMVRLAVARGARVDIDPVGRRMEWGSVNDLSNLVRAHNYSALTRSGDALLRSRGYAGLKEADPDIREVIAERLALSPMDSHVQPLLGLLSDASPSVRAAAVRSLFKMPGTRTFSDLSVLAGENHDEVLYGLLDAARERKIELPRAMLDRLAGHRNPLIRDRVKELIR